MAPPSYQQLENGNEIIYIEFLSPIINPEFLQSQAMGLAFDGIWMGLQTAFLGLVGLFAMLFFRNREAAFVMLILAINFFATVFIRETYIPTGIYSAGKLAFTNYVSIAWGSIALLSAICLFKAISFKKKRKAKKHPS